MKSISLRVLTTAILSAFLFAAALPVAAFADDSTPPPPTEEPAPTNEAAPTDEAAPTEAAPVDEVAPTEEAAPTELVAPIEEATATEEVTPSEPVTEVTEVPVVEEPVVDEAAPEDPSTILAELPEGTDLVVLDAQGEALPLASEEATDVIAGGDPRWCPLGVTPPVTTLASGGCTASYGNLYDLINDISLGNIPQPMANGVIWIQGGVDTSNNTIFIDGNDPNMSIWKNYSLTMKGGWTTIGTGINTGNPSIFDVSLYIYDWNGDISLSDIVFNNVTLSGEYTEAALLVDTEGKIVLTNVDATNNAGNGVVLMNDWSPSKDVIVTNGEFSNNGTGGGGDGLQIWSWGNISLNKVIATDNQMSDWIWDADSEYWWASGGNGANLNNCLYDWDFDTCGVPFAKYVNVTNSTFDFNEGDGIDVFSNGVITLTDITAQNNIYSTIYNDPGGYYDTYGGSGAWLDNQSATTVVGVNLIGTNVFGENEDSGLSISSRGAIKANNIIANANGWGGAWLDNCDWDYDLDICSSSQSIILTGANEFKFNGDLYNGGGIYVTSGGLITLNNVTASNHNGWEGAYLDNSDSPLAVKPGVTLTGTNIFNNNFYSGLYIQSKGPITVNNLTANGNGMSCLWWDWDLDECGEWDGGGALLDNHTASSPAPVNVTVSGGNLDSEFKNNDGYGIEILSKGPISLTGVVAENNGHGGYINNWWDSAVGGITISGWGAGFSNNQDYGLEMYSKGAISFTHLYAWGNGGYGAYIENLGSVTISGATSFGNNGWDFGGNGLEIKSHGAITINTLYAENNNWEGAVLDNGGSGALLPQNVTLTGINTFNNNYDGSGLTIYSYGQISIANLKAYNNSRFGAALNNYMDGSGPAKPILLSGNNTFDWNGWTGLEANSKGAITLNNVQSRDNGWYGANLVNSGGIGAVTINNTSTYYPEFARNGYDGLKILSNGTVTVKDLDAYENGWVEDAGQLYGFGVYIDNSSNTTGLANVLLGTGRADWCNGLSDNFLSGLEVYSNGAVTLSNLCNSGNGKDLSDDPLDEYTPYGYGAYIDNDSASTAKAVTLNGSNRFNDNAKAGIEIYSKGIITLNNMRANSNGWIWDDEIEEWINNGGQGVYADNCSWEVIDNDPDPDTLVCANTFISPIKLTGYTQVDGNSLNGLRVWATGFISVNNLESNDNGGHGAWLFNAFNPNLPQTITLTGNTDVWNNGESGLQVRSYGAITGANITSSENAGYGARLQNRFSGDMLDLWGGGLVLPIADSNTTKPSVVTLTGSNSFNDNGGGLDVISLGAISLSNVEANGWNSSQYTGISLNNAYSTALTPPGITITGGVWTSANALGMYAVTKGPITINVTDAYAASNTSYGWYLDNHSAPGLYAPAVTLSSANMDWAFDFSENGDYGLWIQSKGNITIAGLDASNNGGFGAWLDNAWTNATGTVTILAPATGENSFNGNQGDGLYITSKRAITVGKLSAHDNGLDCSVDPCVPVNDEDGIGVWLDNTYGGSTLAPAITINNYGDFGNNAQDGLWVTSFGIITLNNISAYDNGQYNFWANAQNPVEPTNGSGYGAFVDNASCADYEDCNGVIGKGITLNGTNTFNGNYLDGLWATSLGAINAYNLSADSNGGDGIYLDNQWGITGEVGGVTASGLSGLKNNGVDGLEVYSHGSITLTNITANGNAEYGAYLETFGLITHQNVTLSGKNEFSDNHFGDGLNVYADGNITLSNVTANNNEWDGAALVSEFGTVTLNRTLPGSNTFNGNFGDGLNVESASNVTLNKVIADNNGWDGVLVDTGGTILWACGSTTNNGWGNNSYGWHIGATGTITLKNVWSLGNYENTWSSHPVDYFYRSC
jgi:hypothetical protein